MNTMSKGSLYKTKQIQISLRVGKLSTSLHWLGLRRGVFACVGWQVPVTLHGKRHPLILRWISIKNLTRL